MEAISVTTNPVTSINTLATTTTPRSPNDAIQRQRVTFGDYVRFAVVAGYLAVVATFLIATRRVRPNVSLRRLFLPMLRRKAKGALGNIVHESGHCYVAAVDPRLQSDAEGYSRLQVFEDGKPLAKGHCQHDLIRQQGGGVFSHWNGAIYFSTSDNSNPLENQRTYTFAEQ